MTGEWQLKHAYYHVRNEIASLYDAGYSIMGLVHGMIQRLWGGKDSGGCTRVWELMQSQILASTMGKPVQYSSKIK